MSTACGKHDYSTHKRSPDARINSPPFIAAGTHKLSPLPCIGSCRSLPVEARSAVEGAQSFPPPGNPVGIPPPPTAAATANQVKNPTTEEPARTEGSEQCFRNTRLRLVFQSRRPFRTAPRCSRGSVAAEVRLPPSTYVRQTALGYRLSGRINARAIAQLGRIGNNLNQLTRVANATRRIDQTKRLETVLNELTEAIRYLA